MSRAREGQSAEKAQVERGVVVIQFDFDHDAEVNPLLTVVEGLREFFADREPHPVGNITAAIGGDATRVLEVFDA